MKGLTDEELLDVYLKAVQYRVDEDFIELVKAEIFHRNLSLPPVGVKDQKGSQPESKLQGT